MTTGSFPPQAMHDRALAAYLGLACGDALGATVEFLTPREIEAQYGVHRDIRGGGWLRLKPGQVTDDTQMALYMGRGILAAEGWDVRSVAEAFADWLRSRPADVGNTCRRGIQRFISHGSLSGPESEGDAGNGAAMRLLPAVLATLGNAAATERAVIEQARITHHHPLSDAAVRTLAAMLSTLLLGGGIKDCRPLANALVETHRCFRFDPLKGQATAYIVDTMRTVLHHFFFSDSLEDAIVRTVNRGDDADTTGAIVGMLCGARDGTAALPERWLKRLDGTVAAEIHVQAGELLRLSPAGHAL